MTDQSIFSYLIAAAALLSSGALLLAGRKCRARMEALEWLAVLAIPLGVFCGHLLFAVLQANIYVPMEGIGFLFNPTRGGFMFYGVVLGCLAAAGIVSAWRKVPLRSLLDPLAFALVFLILLIRLSEPFDRAVDPDYGQGFGLMLADEGLEALSFFPIGYAVNSAYSEEIYGAVFLLEAVWALVVLIVTWRGIGKLQEGHSALRAMILYAAGQLFLEFIRQDYRVRWRFTPLSQVISALLLLAVLLTATIRRQIRGRKAIWSWVGLLAGAGLIIAMEFADDGKPLILSDEIKYFFTHGQTYAAILIASVGMGWIVWRSVETEYTKE